MAEPLVTVVMPTWNRPQLLLEAIASVDAQTFPSVEIIVVNDGGMGVQHLLSGLALRRPLTYLAHQENRGLAAARNTALQHARGRFIAYLDDDDRFLPTHVETLIAAAERTGYAVVYTDAWEVRLRPAGAGYEEFERARPYSQDFDPVELLVGNYIPVLCVMHQRDCLEVAGSFDETLRTYEDWDLWIRLSQHYPFLHIPVVTAEFTSRTDGTSLLGRRKAELCLTAARVYQKYGDIAARYPGVLARQQDILARMRALSADA
jgi:glycosyltransferase involved in cell wall biosynthesis